MSHRFAIPVAAFLAASCLLPVLAEESPDGDATRGRQSYETFGCWQCHGTTGAGGGWQGPKLAPNPIPFPAFILQVRTPRGTMPHYPAQLLSDRDVADMHAYLRTIRAGRSAEQIEILKK